MNKIIASLRKTQALNESVLVEAEVKHDGDFVVIIKKDGSEERFKPVGLTAAEVVDKFFSIKKHSEGRAWQWLRKVEREEERQEEIEDEEHVDETTETPAAEEHVDEITEDEPADGKPITEEEDSTTECPYHNLLADLLNKENVTVQDYEAAIIKFNEAPDIPEEKKVRIIEILNHIKDEELEHVNELQEADKILKGEEEAPLNEPEAVAGVEVTDVEPTDNPDELEVTVDAEEETFESIKEAILPDDEVFKLLNGRKFDAFEDVEKLLIDNGFEVVEVFKEGDGFNVNLRKEGVEYFVPFGACEGKFCAVMEKPDERPLEEGLGDWIAAKVAKVIGKGNGLNAKEKMVSDLQAKLGDGVKVVADDKFIKVLPASDSVVTLAYTVDSEGLHLGELKAVDLKPQELADTIKASIGSVGEPAKDGEGGLSDAEKVGSTPIKDYVDKLKELGVDDEADIKKYLLKKFPDLTAEDLEKEFSGK